MKRTLVSVLVAAAMCLSSAVWAKVWLLPDYQASDPFKERTGGRTSKPEPDKKTCASIGAQSYSQVPSGWTCTSTKTVGSEVCCLNMKENLCSTVTYPYTTCSDGKVLSGSSCSDSKGTHYQKCSCNRSVYKYTETDCRNADAKNALSGSTCTEDGITYGTECTDQCKDLKDQTTDYGCEIKYDAPCDHICKVGKSCVPLGSSYLAVCPSGYICNDTKTDCDGTTKYKVTGCAVGYSDFDTFWCTKPATLLSCSEMGYTSGAVCGSGEITLYCPFDVNYVACAKLDE